MLLIGLTGSIATGKSTASTILSSTPHSLPLIDADLLARQVVAPGTSGYRKILRYFSATVPDLLLPPSSNLPESGPDGKGRPLDRAALGRAVFGSSPEKVAARKKLNGIVHPAVRWGMVKLILWYYLLGYWAVVLDVPLLFESQLDIFAGSIIVVGVKDPEVQLRRLLARDREKGGSMTEEEARGRVESQGKVGWKVERVKARGLEKGGWVVWNDGVQGELSEDLGRVVGELRRQRPWWWGALLWVCPPLAVGCAGWCMVSAWWIRRSIVKREREQKERKGD
ncbi:hypothetical protein MMC10_001045 [Thelotrema lepadinum]|nr:hypothetical protein [Thelotrema lepadinum]